MSIDSIFFISCFLPAALLIYWLVPGTRAKNWVLMLLGLLFYSFGSITGLGILLAFTCVNYLIGLILRARISTKLVCGIGVALNLAFLCTFKYLDFIFRDILSLPQLTLGLAAPIGISFFTFKAISYLVDATRDPAKGTKSFPDFLLYISFFPQITAGPISRFSDFAGYLQTRSMRAENLACGIRRFIIGLGKKILIAGIIGGAVDKVFALEVSALDVRLAWVGAIGYCLQIYFDFSGYSDMAIGLGQSLGFVTPENFNYPYIAPTIGNFWRRWHISLSGWFKDYLYIPLGGNRKGKLMAGVNKLIVFTLCGIWHGANWTFILWGLWHGLFSALESLNIIPAKKLEATPGARAIGHVYTLLVVCFGFVMFRATSITQGFGLIAAMFTGWNFTAESTVTLMRLLSPQVLILSGLGIIGCMPVLPMLKKRETVVRYLEPVTWILCLVLFFVCLARLAAGGFTPFIYAQF